MIIEHLEHPSADIWIGQDDLPDIDYSYGGTRMAPAGASDQEVEAMLRRLMILESRFKNRLINLALEAGVVDRFSDRLPPGFLASRVGGGRCVMRPKDEATAEILSDPERPDFPPLISGIFKTIGDYLNAQDGRIKLTPDFGRFAGLADILAEFTPHVLGIRCEDGGCGGKSSYSSTGINEALKRLRPDLGNGLPVTLIGSAGALGEGVLDFVLEHQPHDLAVCDLVYDSEGGSLPPSGLKHLPSEYKAFTDPCLERGGVIVATTWGEELENSSWRDLPTGTLLLLAHNLALPLEEEGVAMARALAEREILAFPGQILTLGGALTSRIEWFWRQWDNGELFDKELGHDVVRLVVDYWVRQGEEKQRQGITNPYELMLEHCLEPGEDPAPGIVDG